MSKSGKKPKRPDPMRLVGPNGEFVSSFPKNGNTVTVGHLEELCEWIYHHNNMTNAEKLERITQVEGMIGMYFSGEDENGNLIHEDDMPFGMPVKYVPTWSKKLISNEKRRNKKRTDA